VSEHRILVVDDEPSIVDAVATALRYEGYDVEEATTGREALGAVARFEPDLCSSRTCSSSPASTKGGRSSGNRSSSTRSSARPSTSRSPSSRSGRSRGRRAGDAVGGSGARLRALLPRDQSRSRASGGVGLGLSIVAAVAEAHGGEVSAHSEPGKGSTFRITLPLAS
jgi:Histidine kinase-, DNA gyrase B-, and HSP90-like ATPase/Response regulator receiver domain